MFTLLHTATGAEVKSGDALTGRHQEVNDPFVWSFERIHTFPDAAGKGAMLSVRHLARGNKTTTAAESFLVTFEGGR